MIPTGKETTMAKDKQPFDDFSETAEKVGEMQKQAVEQNTERARGAMG